MEVSTYPEKKVFFDLLFGFLQSDGGLPYYSGNTSSSEPTLLGILALLANDFPEESFKLSLEWVIKTKNSDGSIGLNRKLPKEGVWATSHLAIVFHWLGKTNERNKAIQFLKNFRSVAVEPNEFNTLDSRLIGWPWVSNTFSWVEPTCWALLALKLAGEEKHPRALEGQNVLLDRCIKGGGWNCGNRLVYGNDLLPFLDTTSMAILALISSVDEAKLTPSIAILEANCPGSESIYELAWCILCFKRLKKNTGFLEKKLVEKILEFPKEILNVVHLALALIALSNKPVLAK